MPASLGSIIWEMVPDTFPKGLRSAWNKHRFGPKETAAHISLRFLADRRDVDRGARFHAMLSYNTFLMRAELPWLDLLFPSAPNPLEDIPIVGGVSDFFLGLGPNAVKGAIMGATGSSGVVAIEEKPALKERASEIGAAIANGAGGDIAVLCEIWADDLFERIVAPIKNAGLGLQVIKGPQAKGMGLGSGLYVLGINQPITEMDRHVFKNKGHPLKDADFHSRKSIILNQIDVDVGVIDLYSTHLHSGGDLPDLKIVNNVPSEEDKQAVRLAQCAEMVAFINATHDKTHIAILTGDFNVNAVDQTAHFNLVSLMAQANLFDAWSIQYEGTAVGKTNGDFHKVCAGASGSHCDEAKSSLTEASGSRIDYVFVEAPTISHTFNLDLTVIRRNPFKRAVATEKQEFMSDHLGLSFGLICSPLLQ